VQFVARGLFAARCLQYETAISLEKSLAPLRVCQRPNTLSVGCVIDGAARSRGNETTIVNLWSA